MNYPNSEFKIFDRMNQKYLVTGSLEDAVKRANEVGENVIFEHTRKDVIAHHRVGDRWMDAKAYEAFVNNTEVNTDNMTPDEHIKHYLQRALFIQDKGPLHHFVHSVEGIRPVFVSGEFDDQNKYLEKFRDYIATCVKVIHDPYLRENERFELLDNHEFIKLAQPRPDVLETQTQFDAIQSFTEDTLDIDRAQKFARDIASRFDVDFEAIYNKNLIPVDASKLNYKSELGITVLAVGGKPVLQVSDDIEAETAIVENAYKYIHQLATHHYNSDHDKLERSREALQSYINDYANDLKTVNEKDLDLYYLDPQRLKDIIETQSKNLSDLHGNEKVSNRLTSKENQRSNASNRFSK